MAGVGITRRVSQQARTRTPGFRTPFSKPGAPCALAVKKFTVTAEAAFDVEQQASAIQNLELLADFSFDAAALSVVQLALMGRVFPFTGEGVGSRELKSISWRDKITWQKGLNL
jgi:hypothetical protein